MSSDVGYWRSILTCQMTRHAMPAKDPYQRPFYIGAAVVVGLLLLISFISLQPEKFSWLTLRLIGWTAMALVVAAVIGAQVLSLMAASWRAKQRCAIELADGKLIQTRDGSVIAEIPVAEIHSLQEGWGWLVAKSGEKLIPIPVQVEDYAGLKRELSAHATITPLKPTKLLLPLLLHGLMIAGCVLVFFSHQRRVIEIAGAITLFDLILGMVLYHRRMRTRFSRAFFFLSYGWFILVIAWSMFIRLKEIR